MSLFCVYGKQIEADLVVFDKDGLLFSSKQFWIALAESRMREMERYLKREELIEWIELMGCTVDTAKLCVIDIDPFGIMAVASPKEETAISAGFLVWKNHCDWTRAVSDAIQVFEGGNKRLNLIKALSPRKGFPGIFYRLAYSDIPFCIATSDTHERAMQSTQLFCPECKPTFIVTPADVKHGKPYPDMLLKVQQLTGCDPKRMLMIGDSYVDVEMAFAVGAKSLLIPEYEEMVYRTQAKATAVARSLDDLIILS